MIPESLLNGDNAAFLDDRYQAWLADPQAVEPSLRTLFEDLGRVPVHGPSVRPRSIFAAIGGGPGRAMDAREVQRAARVVQLINAYRMRGHLGAAIDPLDRRERVVHPELTLEHWGLEPADLDAQVDTAPVFGVPPRMPLRDLVAHLREAYCASIGAEFMNIVDTEQRRWVQEQLETLPGRGVLTPVQERRVFRKLCDAENFERMLHARFPGTKRFSIEGAETLVPLLDMVVEHAARRGVREIVVGMAHRGRLNTLVNVLEKPIPLIISEFQDFRGTTQGSGDVKYHVGFSSDLVTVGDQVVHVSLTPNPSHLEVVNAVVEGRVRAKQDRSGEQRTRSMALLVHGDAAFSGQGSVMEVLNFSELPGYRTGGTVHVIVNNQIGFTTPPAEQRSTPYATDIARMLAVPIFHVNGEVPRAVAAVVQMAVEYRTRFARDVVIDMYCYRKHGHNEGDEPSFTQPKLYETIRSHPSPREVYAKHLVHIGTLTPEECDRIYEESFAALVRAADRLVEPPKGRAADRDVGAKGEDPDLASYARVDRSVAVKAERTVDSPLKDLWAEVLGGSPTSEVDTTFDRARLIDLLRRANTLPEGFQAHAKILRLLAQRMRMIEGEDHLDWAMGEQAAYATLLDQGFIVRLSGQDSGRGTFSHRHAIMTDVRTGEELFPLGRLDTPGRFWAIDSTLSELGVVGFEIGYAFDTPDALVMWEAQFGDFANGAQIYIDQYLAASEQKWGRHCGLVMLLPHGYEGQGPEHSSARPERFLLACAENNMEVANCTTPASLFHLLRRQVLRNVRRPLIVLTPKSLLRHHAATSTIDELANGAFRAVLPDERAPAEVRRVVLCSGKVYYDLLAKRGNQPVALVRVELLYPFPADAIAAELARYPGAEVVWCQEEPRNMGAWPTYLHWFLEHLPDVHVRYVGRPPSASPATGSHSQHQLEQQALVDAALEFP